MSIAVALAVAAIVGIAVAWRRRNAPILIGEGIRAIERISRPTPRAGVSAGRAGARRRRQVRLTTSVCLLVLAVATLVSSHRRGWFELLAAALLLRVVFEVLARRTHR